MIRERISLYVLVGTSEGMTNRKYVIETLRPVRAPLIRAYVHASQPRRP